MSFAKTALLRHPLVERAYDAVNAAVGLEAAEVKEAIAAAEIYSSHVAAPNAEVVAALLFNNYAYPQVASTLGPKVEALTDFALEMAGIDTIVDAQGNADQADIILAQVAVQATVLQQDIARGDFYVYQVMQAKLRCLSVMASRAEALTDSSGLVLVAQEALVSAQNAQAARNAKVLSDSVFANAALPAHPLIERVYEDMRRDDLKVNPHMAPLSFERAALDVLLAEVKHLDPEMIAAMLLNQCFRSTPEITAEYGSRVAELHHVTAPLAAPSGSKPDFAGIEGAADILAAIRVMVLEDSLSRFAHVSKESKEDALYDLEQRCVAARKLEASGEVSVRLAQRLSAAASAAQNLVHAPEHVAIRKPGSPRPPSGY